ncbi:MAG: LamG-like jellyroll fold domain-containing protein [Candidatus Paceibacterota bacterium]|jgi:hypothetical protein|nr:hypothetical protein [Candidatus Paceibacterota bacterium]
MNIKDKKIKLIIFAAVMITVSFGFGKEILAAPSWTFGIVPQSGGKLGGGALEFDGDDYVDIGNVGNVQAVEFWLNNSNTADGILELINNSTYVSISGGAITATGFTSPTIYVNGSSASASLATGWNHVVITDTASVAAASFQIGEANGDYMSGIIDEVSVYNRALSDAEVRFHYNKGGPVAHWKLNDGSGSTAYDSTENNIDGTLYGEMATSTTYGWVSGKQGSALSFDGVDDYVDVGDTSQNIKTISFWLVAGATNEKILDLDGGTRYIEIDSSSDIQAQGFTSPAIYINGVQGSRISTNTWQHVVVITNTAIDANNVDLGRVSANYFYGIIDEVRLYNYVRTAEEIRLDYNAGFKARF